MRMAALAIPILILLASCSGIVITGIDLSSIRGASLSVKNEGRFTMSVNVPSRIGGQLVPVGQTAVWKTFPDGLNVNTMVNVSAGYSEGRLGNGGSWSTSVYVSDGDDLKLTIPDCPGWEYYMGSIYSIAYGNGVFAALGRGSLLRDRRCLWSRDGTSGSWKVGQDIAGCYEIEFLNARFVVVGAGELFSSTDLGAWFCSWSGSFYGMSCIAYGNNRFVAAGFGGAYWSTNCSPGSWSETYIGPGFINDIAFGNNRFVAVDEFGKAACSPDGSQGSWTISCAASRGLNGIAYGNNRFVTVGKEGTVSWSPDGSPDSWTESRACGGDLEGIAFGNNRFVAVGKEGEVIWSPDGSPDSWTESSTGGADLFGITYGSGRFMAVGSSGRIMSSPDGSPGSWTEIRLFE